MQVYIISCKLLENNDKTLNARSGYDTDIYLMVKASIRDTK